MVARRQEPTWFGLGRHFFETASSTKKVSSIVLSFSVNLCARLDGARVDDNGVS